MSIFTRRYPGPNVNTGSAYPPARAAKTEGLADALKSGMDPESLGHAIGIALVRQYGAGRAYVVSDAIARGIQHAMKGGE